MIVADPRDALRALVAGRAGETLAALSRLIGRNPAYLQQYLERGSPRRLAEQDRRLLARYFGVGEAVLGGPAPSTPELVHVPRRAVRAAAGPGAINDGEAIVGEFGFSARMLRTLGTRGPLSTVRATGTSMMPGIADGDEMLVDEGDRRLTALPGIFVLRIDGALAVKRASRRAGALVVTSDNPDAPAVTGEAIEVIGRVVWLGRPLR
jgi:phage repressor protein C with HTH and peptisase S24 domain